ncbi:MAG: hypothetical protein V7K35_00720 [Nostoc sp.]|uniref:hypothetical protein n=1 Tax=Nostoc sp. TaxID=1180 RepID=UPI002FF83743
MRIKVEASYIVIKKIVNAIALGNKKFSDERRRTARRRHRFLLKIKKDYRLSEINELGSVLQ